MNVFVSITEQLQPCIMRFRDNCVYLNSCWGVRCSVFKECYTHPNHNYFLFCLHYECPSPSQLPPVHLPGTFAQKTVSTIAGRGSDNRMEVWEDRALVRVTYVRLVRLEQQIQSCLGHLFNSLGCCTLACGCMKFICIL